MWARAHPPLCAQHMRLPSNARATPRGSTEGRVALQNEVFRRLQRCRGAQLLSHVAIGAESELSKGADYGRHTAPASGVTPVPAGLTVSRVGTPGGANLRAADLNYYGLAFNLKLTCTTNFS
jgi:hypothetical protein